MGSSSSRYYVYDDRYDYDDCCGCGPWYGGESYRISRSRWLPGFGSPRYNNFGPGGYAGEVIPAPYATGLPPPVPIVPTSTAIVPLATQVVAPGYMSSYTGGPYRPVGVW